MINHPQQSQIPYIPSDTMSFESPDIGVWIKRISEEQCNLITGKYRKGNVIRILSGYELFVSYGDGKNQRTWLTDFDFRGTLIYFDLPISSFEDADYFDDVEL